MLNKVEYLWAGRRRSHYDANWTFSEAMQNLPDETARYDFFLWRYRNVISKELRNHRKFFNLTHRGFGEDAFHALWESLFDEFRPKNCLEIGVYRGQVISLWSLLSDQKGIRSEVWGLSPLTSAGDAVSQYMEIDYVHDIESSYAGFGLGKPNLFKAKSQDADGIAFARSRKWDVVYVDGSHDYNDVLLDVRLAEEILSNGGILVMDDASKYSHYHPRWFAFSGHHGPSKVAGELAGSSSWKFVGSCGHNRVFQKLDGSSPKLR